MRLATRRACWWLALCALALLPGAASAATTPPDFSDTSVAAVASPTALASTPDGRILIATQSGQLRVYQNGALQTTAALDLSSSVCFNFERGLLGVAVDPAFADNHFIYVFAARKKADGSCVNRVSRFTLEGESAALTSEAVLFDNIYVNSGGEHSGGDLFFGKDGMLYVSVGDGYCDYAKNSGCAGLNDAARDTHVPLGKILRITRDGAVPPDNPYASTGGRCGVAGITTPGLHCQETFARGLRNPFRFAFDPNAASTRFFINDVGQADWEEINAGQAGADYGWNVREGHCVRGSRTDCPAPPAGMTDPIFDYSHAAGCSSITGGAFVPAGVWPAPYSGAYLYSDYVCGKIFRLVPLAGGGFTSADFATGLGSSSAVAMAFGPHGDTQALYYTSYAGGGEVRRIAYTGVLNRPPTAQLSASPTTGPVPLAVTLNGGGSSDPDPGDTLTYLWDFGDGSPATETSEATTTHTYENAGSYTARLRVRDNRGAVSDERTVVVHAGNTPPTAQIELPTEELRFKVGQQVTLRGSAIDPEDGPLPNSQLSWQVLRHHNNDHTHPFLQPTQGNDLTITSPAPEDLPTAANSYLEVRLTATDSKGATSTVTRLLRPKLVQLAFATDPGGLGLLVEGTNVATPHTVTSWEGYSFPVEARQQPNPAGGVYEFASWSDGGAAAHSITTPATDATYTARFTEVHQTNLEAEKMTLPSGARIEWRSGLSGGAAVAMFNSGALSKSLPLPSSGRLTVRASGDQCEGAPAMTVLVDGAQVMSAPVPSTAFADYSANVNVPAGTHEVRVAFTNDLYRAGICDRNLRVDKLTFSSAPSGGTADVTPPAAPSGLAASAGDGQVALDWADNSETDLDGYRVFRSTTAGGPYTAVNATLLTSSALTDTGRTNGTRYFYVVRAVDKSGNVSPASVEVSAVPQGVVSTGPAVVLEGEAMTRPSTAKVYWQTGLSKGAAVKLFTNGQLTASALLPSVTRVTLRARGDQCLGAPVASLLVDGVNVATHTVSATAFTDYTAAVPIGAGAHSVAIVFGNDLYRAGVCDRNLDVDKLTFSP
ncbi:MAG TPA: PQQ-dependent sugar dehydrogenase [Thermoleophilaceae bacterium]|nr:PQQ-dependent sugar dehydrogenase [Thermoleophilaceae bacterium]